MTVAVAGDYAKARVKGAFKSAELAYEEKRLAHLASGRRIAHTLGELKGAAMKVGQMATIASSVLPPEVIDSLRTLQRSAPPMSYELVAHRIRLEFGVPVEELFRTFSKEPCAAASIGQVHRAQLDDGREAAVKVQYPGVEDAVDSDLSHLKLALRASGLASLHASAHDEAFEELRQRLHEELDYVREAENLARVQAFHAARHPFVRIAEVVPERSTKRVLTLTYEGGDPLHALDGLGYTQAERDRLGVHLSTFFLDEVFAGKLVHADPHPGNFAVRHDGTLIVYDFGCIKGLPESVVSASRDLLESAGRRDLDAVDLALVGLGVRNPEGPKVQPSWYAEWCDFYIASFRTTSIVDFGYPTGVQEFVTKQIPIALQNMRSFQPSKHLMLLNRTIVGHYGNLRTLRARVPVSELLDQRVFARA